MKNRNFFLTKKTVISELFLNGRQFSNLERSRFSLEKLVYTSFKGIGESLSNALITRLGVPGNKKLATLGLTEEEIQTLLDRLQEMVQSAEVLVDQTLDRFVDDNIVRKIQSGSYKGHRFLQALTYSWSAY